MSHDMNVKSEKETPMNNFRTESQNHRKKLARLGVEKIYLKKSQSRIECKIKENFQPYSSF